MAMAAPTVTVATPFICRTFVFAHGPLPPRPHGTMASKQNVLLILLFTCEQRECVSRCVVCSQYDEMIRCLPFSCNSFLLLLLVALVSVCSRMFLCHVSLMLRCGVPNTATTAAISCKFIYSIIPSLYRPSPACTTHDIRCENGFCRMNRIHPLCECVCVCGVCDANKKEESHCE